MEDLKEEIVPSWSVTRRIVVADLETLGADQLDIPGLVVTDEGYYLGIGPAISTLADRSFAGELAVQGLFERKLPVEIEVAIFAHNTVELSLQPAGRYPRFGLSARRYFKAACAVIDELGEIVAASPVGAFEEAQAA